MHLIAYIYAIISLAALLFVIVAEFRRKRTVAADCQVKLPPPDDAVPANKKEQAARTQLQAACRQDAEFHLAHQSLGLRQLDRRRD